MAVDVFMVLSGFLMAYTMSDQARIPRKGVWLNFYIRRIFRIAPAYYGSLIIAVLLSSQFLSGYVDLMTMNQQWPPKPGQLNPASVQYDFKNMLLHLTFLFSLHPTYSSSTALPDWSLGIEMQFYAVFPLIYLVGRRYSHAGICLILFLLCFGFSWLMDRAVALSYLPPFRTPSLLIFKLDIFILGILIFEAGRDSKNRIHLLIVAVIIETRLLRWSGNDGFVFLFILLLIAVLWLAPYRPRWLHNILENRVVRFMSDTSYSVYLFHGFFISIVGSRIARWLWATDVPKPVAFAAIWIAVIGLVYPCAYLSYRFVEVPGIRLGKRISEAVRPRIAVPSASA